MLALVAAGCPGHGPFHLLVGSAEKNGLVWDPEVPGWLRPGLPLVSHLAGLYQHLKTAILDAWRRKVCRRENFCAGPLLDIASSL